MRIRDWYFQGWERRETADGKSPLVYTGEYYRPAPGLRPAAPLLAFGLAALYLLVALVPSPGGMWHYAAIPQLLEIIPLIYLILGAVCLLRAGDALTYRDWYASWRRMTHAAAWSLGFTGLMAAVEIAYLVLAPEPPVFSRELPYLAGELACAALSLVLLRFLRKRPCTRSMEGPEKE